MIGMLVLAALWQGTPPRDTTPPKAAPLPRASWLSDRRPLRPGDLLTVFVDERISASERNATKANSTRSQGGDFNLGLSATPSTPKNFDIGYSAKSDQNGQADRSQGLAAVLSVRVISIEPSGAAKIEGRRTVAVDGRKQEIILTGLVRPEDVSSSNSLPSSRIADASITYKGKNIGPKTGIFGKILGMLWP
jgi:flagellar L-ring protein precursor FlgH